MIELDETLLHLIGLQLFLLDVHGGKGMRLGLVVVHVYKKGFELFRI